MDEIKLTKEQARELLKNIWYRFDNNGIDIKETIKLTIKKWELENYIEQSREEEIREKLNMYSDSEYPFNKDKEKILLQDELIKILDNKIKELKQ